MSTNQSADMDESTNATVSNVTLNNIFDMPLSTKPIPEWQQALKISIFIFGFIAYLVIFLVIVYSRQLHFPRHIFWAGVTLINYYDLIQCVLEFVARVHHSLIACKIYVFNASVAYTSLLLCLSLAACDRYSAIAHYEWYKKRITNRVVIIAIATGFTVSFFVTTSPFWTDCKSPSKCTVNLTHMHWVLLWDVLLGIFSVALHVKIYIASRDAIRQYAPNLNQFPLTQRFVAKNESNPAAGT